MSQYSDKIIILRSGVLEILINAGNISSEIVSNKDKETVIKTAVKTIRENVIDFCNTLPETSWPRTIDEPQFNMCSPPESVTQFLLNLLHDKNSKSTPSSITQRQVESYSADFIHGVSNGEALTAKHFLLGCGFHNLTGKRNII